MADNKTIEISDDKTVDSIKKFFDSVIKILKESDEKTSNPQEKMKIRINLEIIGNMHANPSFFVTNIHSCFLSNNKTLTNAGFKNDLLYYSFSSALYHIGRYYNNRTPDCTIEMRGAISKFYEDAQKGPMQFLSSLFKGNENLNQIRQRQKEIVH